MRAPVRCGFLAALIVVLACSSESKEDGGPDASGGSATGGAGGAGASQAGGGNAGGPGGSAGSAGSAGSGGALVMCSEAEVRCRGACFATVGQVGNGCELVARVTGSATAVESLATNGTALVSVEYSDGTYRLVRRDPPAFMPTELAVNRFQRTPKIAGDTVYVNGSYVVDRTSDTGILSVPMTGGSPALVVDPLPGMGDAVPFEIIDDMLYFFGEYVAGLHRVPLAGGADELVLMGDVTSVTADATDFYYHSSGLDFQIRRSPRSDPMAYAVVAGTITAAHVFLQPASPAYVYYYFGDYSRVVKGGGEPEVVLDPPFGGLFEGVGPEHLLLSAPAIQPGLYAVTLDGATTTAVDDGDGDTTGFVETESAYFFARDDAIFRVAK